MNKYNSKTAKLYNAGFEIDKAILKGADSVLFNELEAEFKGASIPQHLINGTEYKAPYSCDYHSGGSMGKQLREAIKNANN